MSYFSIIEVNRCCSKKCTLGGSKMNDKVGELTYVRRLQNGDRTYYFGTITSDKLKSLTFVPAIESGQQNYINEILEDGYQRPGSPSRMRRFSKYLVESPNSVVPPVILSSRGKWRFRPDNESGIIGSLELYGPAATIDGQHRIGGYIHLYEDSEDIREISFILLDNLTIKEESKEFTDINNTQIGVPRALFAYLEGSPSAQIAWELNIDPGCPFYGRISKTTVKPNQLFALHSVANQMKELFKMGGLNDLDQDVKVTYASRYFTVISDVWQMEWADIELLDDEESSGRRSFNYKMLELTGLIAWCRIGSIILHRCYTEDLGMNWDKVKDFVEITGNIDWGKKRME